MPMTYIYLDHNANNHASHNVVQLSFRTRDSLKRSIAVVEWMIEHAPGTYKLAFPDIQAQFGYSHQYPWIAALDRITKALQDTTLSVGTEKVQRSQLWKLALTVLPTSSIETYDVSNIMRQIAAVRSETIQPTIQEPRDPFMVSPQSGRVRSTILYGKYNPHRR